MKSLFRHLAAILALVAFVPAAPAAVLTFDDLNGSEFFSTLGQSYHGFNFGCSSGCGVGSWYWDDSNPDPVPYYKSANTWVTTNPGTTPVYGASLGITNSNGFIFDGAWFTSYDDDITVKFELLLGGQHKAWSNVLTMNWQEPSAFLSSGYSGLVDEVRVWAYQGYFQMDDFTYRVPEPGSVGLALLALGGLGAIRRRKGAK